MSLNAYKKMIVMKKTQGRCSICGSEENVKPHYFVPDWTRIVGDDLDNIIPLCENCEARRELNFIEVGRLKYLPDVHIEQLMRYYKTISKYLHKYVRLYGEYRTNGKLDVSKALLTLDSYEQFINEDVNKFKWEDI